MTADLPDYLLVKPEELGRGGPVRVRVLTDLDSVARDLAESIVQAIQQARQSGRAATFIVPVGPVDQYPILAARINEQRIDCREVMLINMDEYLTDDDRWVDADHPLSFRGYMNRRFYDLLDAALAPRPENRVFPDPCAPASIQTLIQQRGGVDVCYGGIGINGHMAFNEPPEPGESLDTEAFAGRPTRVLALSCETRTVNSVTVGGEIGLVPRRAVTVGMREILTARQCRFYCNRPWQSAVVRRVLHGPITAACPASLLRTHPDAEIAVAEYVAAMPDIQLR